MTEVTLAIFECGSCGIEAVPLEGYGTACHECSTGTFDRKTGDVIETTIGESHLSDVADSVIVSP